MNPVLWAFAANISFAIASIFYAHYAHRFGVLWINIVKALIAVTGFISVTIIIGQDYFLIPLKVFGLLFISGFIGMGIGDILLLSSFKTLGPGRTLILFGFQPVTVGLLSYLFLGQEVYLKTYVSVFFFILCLSSFSIEKFKSSKSWGLYGLLIAFGGVTLDSFGTVLSRMAFDITELSSMQANSIRLSSALIAYALFVLLGKRPKVIEKIKLMNFKEKLTVIFACVMGTFLSLLFHLQAVKTGKLALISGVGITGPIFSTIFEHIHTKKRPSALLFIALFFFVIGFAISQEWIDLKGFMNG